MNRRWSLAAIPVLALGLAAAGTGTADAAAAKPKVKSYVETDRVRLTGVGRNAGWAYKNDFTIKNDLGAKLAFDSVGHWSNTFKSQGHAWHDIVVNSTDYNSLDGKPWTTKAISPQQLAKARVAADPMRVPPLMYKLKVAHHVGKGHWRATGSITQLAPFINGELNLGTADFNKHGYKRLTIDLWIDSKGRPTKVTASGTAYWNGHAWDVRGMAWEKASITETFTNYDKPLTIVPPKA